jgi:hypothetical protein
MRSQINKRRIAMQTRIQKLVVSLSVLGLVLLIGCMTTSTFRENGLPSERYVVGGGYTIEYKAPSNGTAYWVEETSSKIIESKSVEEGEAVQFELDADADEFKEATGIDLKDAKFTLYFVPAEE